MNLQLSCPEKDDGTILLKTRGFGVNKDNLNAFIPKKKRSRRRRSRKIKQSDNNQELESNANESVKKTESTQMGENQTLFPLHVFEDFYLYNLQSPTFTVKDKKNNRESVKTELFLSAYFKNVETNDKKIVEKINYENNYLNIDDLCSDNHDLFLTDSNFINITDKELDKELGLIDYSLTVSPVTSPVTPPTISPTYFPKQQQQQHFTYPMYYYPCQFQQQPIFVNGNGTPIELEYDYESIRRISRNDHENRILSYENMKIEKILKLNFCIQELAELNLIVRLMKDQYGSRYLQNVIKSYNSIECLEIITFLINYLISNNINLTEMSQDIYGNYLIQLFFVRGNDSCHKLLFDNFIYKSTLQLCKSKYGCRVIQKILSCVTNRNRLIELVNYFKIQTENMSDIDECLLCCNTNHVIQAMIELKLPYKTMLFIKDTLEENLAAYSENVYACRVVQSFITIYGDKLNVNKLFINNNHLVLSQVKYGNYVIQCIIKKDQWYSNLSDINQFRNKLINDVFMVGNILSLGKDKHGSNVIETCIKVASEKQINQLIDTICSKQGFLLKQLMFDKFGNYIPKTLLLRCINNKQQTVHLINTIHWYITNLYSYYHKYTHCSELITKCQQIKYDMDTQYYNKNNTYKKTSI